MSELNAVEDMGSRPKFDKPEERALWAGASAGVIGGLTFELTRPDPGRKANDHILDLQARIYQLNSVRGDAATAPAAQRHIIVQFLQHDISHKKAEIQAIQDKNIQPLGAGYVVFETLGAAGAIAFAAAALVYA